MEKKLIKKRHTQYTTQIQKMSSMRNEKEKN